MLFSQDFDDWDDEERDSLKLEPEDSLDLAEACFRDMFFTHKARGKRKYFVIGWEHLAKHKYSDPDADFVARFNKIRPKVKKLSYYYDNEKKLTGKVLMFYMGDIWKIDDDLAIVRCGYWYSDDEAYGCRYLMKYEDGLWQVKKSFIEWQM